MRGQCVITAFFSVFLAGRQAAQEMLFAPVRSLALRAVLLFFAFSSSFSTRPPRALEEFRWNAVVERRLVEVGPTVARLSGRRGALPRDTAWIREVHGRGGSCEGSLDTFAKEDATRGTDKRDESL